MAKKKKKPPRELTPEEAELKRKRKEFREAVEERVKETQRNIVDHTIESLAEPTTLTADTPVWRGLDGSVTDAQPDGAVADAEGVLVPDMAATAGEGPVYGAPLVRVRPPEGIKPEEFRRVISISYQLYLVDGNIKAEDVLARTPVSQAKTKTILTSMEYRAAMRYRGVEANPTGLTEEMDYALLILTDPHDGLTFKKKLEKAKISSAKYQAWLRNPYFKRQMDVLTERLVSNNHEAFVMLSQKVGEGDLNAIKLQLAINNRYNPANEAQQDIIVMLKRMLEVVYRNVKDPDTLRAIADEMTSLADGSVRRSPALIEQPLPSSELPDY